MSTNKKTKKKESEFHTSWLDVMIEFVVSGFMEVVFLLPRFLFRAVKAIID
jgi:hypothetical protein